MTSYTKILGIMVVEYVCIYIYIEREICIYIYTYIYIQLYMCICIYIYIHVYIYAYTFRLMQDFYHQSIEGPLLEPMAARNSFVGLCRPETASPLWLHFTRGRSYSHIQIDG